jgi:hypothetical protein
VFVWHTVPAAWVLSFCSFCCWVAGSEWLLIGFSVFWEREERGWILQGFWKKWVVKEF